ncbi:MAG: 5-(carboxyamino)imidazole ribonucleotide synthase [Myxococcaceae bacterium]
MKKILPGSTIGVLGSGQLGRMFAIAARQMGYRVHTLSPETDTPTGQVADVEVTVSYDDLDAVRAFAKKVSVVTFEFENIPLATVQAASELTLVRPNGNVLHTTQHRLREKNFLSANGFPVAPYVHIKSRADLDAAIDTIGVPAVLKSAGFGYDGKGQHKLASKADADDAYRVVGGGEAILEAFVDFACEMSVIGARTEGGEFTHFGAVENEHRNHILDLTLSPGRIPELVARDAVSIARSLMEALDVVGVMCVEMFLTKAEKILVNELAPRPHNSGHFSIDACATSQFEQQVRTVCGLPLGSTYQPQPAALVNLLGDLWAKGEPRWVEALKDPRLKLHLYGKLEPQAGRKMGHMTAAASTLEEAKKIAVSARARLG